MPIFLRKIYELFCLANVFIVYFNSNFNKKIVLNLLVKIVIKYHASNLMHFQEEKLNFLSKGEKEAFRSKIVNYLDTKISPGPYNFYLVTYETKKKVDLTSFNI